jgi:hypothetical protein
MAWSKQQRQAHSKRMRKAHKRHNPKQRTLFKMFGYTILLRKDWL